MDNLSVNELDFDAIKQELITFLSAQTEFQDYDFTGSALNTLVDVCAYLIHYVGVQANFALRESFLTSAQLRKNVTSIAKEVGYFPAQKKAGRSSFTLTLDLTGLAQPSSLVVPKGTTFVSTLDDGSSVLFTTFDDNPMVDTGLAANLPATEVWQGTVYVAQGTFANQFWVVTGTDQRYLIDQEGIDTDFLSVSVRPNQSSSTISIWAYGKNITEVGPATEAYFLSEYNDGVEIYFGNNVIGAAVQAGNYIEAEYLVTQGSVSNGLKTFALTTDIQGYNRADFVLSNISPVTDGADRETVDSIRYLAPLSYQRQNRIVTLEDYKVAVLENYNNVKAINAWGGEDAEPPEYGKVFVSVAPVYGDQVSPTTKKSIEEDILARFSVVGITPELVDPEYLQINLVTTVVYNKDRTTTKASELVSQVQSAIVNHFDNQVFDYNQSFKYSRFLGAVDDTHDAITHSLATVNIAKKFTPTSNVTSTYTIKLYNSLQANTVQSTTWTATNGASWQLKDNGLGVMNLYANGTLIRSNVGTVDYVTGVVSLPGFNAQMLTIAAIHMTATPAVNDVAIRFNNLAQLGTNTVVVKDIREA